MSLLRKTSNFLRLEPGRDAWLKQFPHGSARVGVSPEELQPLIRTLLEEPSLESVEAQKVITQLRSLSTKAGAFLTASEIQRCLNGFNFSTLDGQEQDGSRAYELAAKLHWEHLQRQIEAIEAESRPMGPTVFATFLEEMVECLIRGDDARRAVAIPVVLADALLEKTLDLSLHTLDYVVLAERAIGVSLDCCADWIAKHKPVSEDDEEAETEEREAESGTLTQDLIAYLRELEGAFKRVGEELNELLAPIESSALVADCDAATRAERLRDYHQVLERIGDQAGYAPFQAMVLDRMSRSSQDEDSERARTLMLKSAELFDMQAEIEERLGLDFLQHRREKRSKSLRDGDAARPSDSDIA